MQTLGEYHIGYIVLSLVILLAMLFFFINYCYYSNPLPNRQAPTVDPEHQIDHVQTHVIFIDEDELHWHRHPRLVLGLTNEVIECYCPKFPYFSSTQFDELDDGRCSICLSEYEEREMLRFLPECGHRFHLVCLDSWLNINGSCPVCRTFAVKKPSLPCMIQTSF